MTLAIATQREHPFGRPRDAWSITPDKGIPYCYRLRIHRPTLGGFLTTDALVPVPYDGEWKRTLLTAAWGIVRALDRHESQG